MDGLQMALAANAAFSATTGLTAVALASPLARTLGPPGWALRLLGVGLVVFAVFVGREARSPSRVGTLRVVAADIAWVAAAAVVLAVTPRWLSDAGRSVLAAVSVVVGLLAAAQWRGLEVTS